MANGLELMVPTLAEVLQLISALLMEQTISALWIPTVLTELEILLMVADVWVAMVMISGLRTEATVTIGKALRRTV